MSVVVPPTPALRVIPDVELLEVGMNWPLMSDGKEDGTFTPEDLAAAVDAQDDPAVRSPVLKLGHGSSKLNGGEPCFGRVQNLRTTNDGMTLVGDLVGVPSWLAGILPHAWPSRSVEGQRNKTTATGKTHALVLDGLALLGVHLPAISTLEDVRAVYSAETMEDAGVTLTMAQTTARDRDSGAVPTVAASTTTEDIRRSYYDSLGSGEQWWWIREIELDPLTLIVDDDEGGLWRVPVTVSGTDITFGDPEAVRVEYVAAEASPPAGAQRSIVYASRAESRPQEESTMDLTELRERLGLSEDATDEAILTAAVELLPDPTSSGAPAGDATGDTSGDASGGTPAPSAQPAPPASSSTVPEGAVLVDAEQWAEVQRQAQEGATVAAVTRQRDRDSFITNVMRAGRLTSTNKRLRATLEREWDRDPVAAQEMAAELAQVVPVTEAGHAHSEGSPDVAWDDVERGAFPSVAAVRAERERKDA